MGELGAGDDVASPSRRPWAQLRALRLVRVCNAFLGLEGAIATPFFGVILHRCALDAGAVGVVLATRNATALVCAPAWAALSDYTRGHTRVLRAVTVLRLLPGAALLLEILACRGVDDLPWLPWHATWATQGSGAQLLALCVTAACASLFQTPVQTQLDAAALRLLGGRRSAYGSIRAWLSVGMATGALAAGVVLQHAGVAAVLLLLLALTAVDTAFAWGLCATLDADTKKHSTDTVTAAPRPAGRSAACRLLLDWHMLLFLALSVVNGVGNATYDVYIMLFMSELHATGFMLGLAVAVGCASNIAFFFLAEGLLRHVGSRGMIVAGTAAFVARACLYAQVQQPWQVLPIQLLHGVNFSCLWAGSVAFARSRASASTATLSVGLLQGAFFGAGGLVGLYVGGWLFDALGARRMFLVKAAATAAALAVFVLAEVLPHACRRRSGRATQRGRREGSPLLQHAVDSS